MSKRKNNTNIKQLVTLIIVVISAIVGLLFNDENSLNGKLNNTTEMTCSIEDIPKYSDKPYVIINENIPNFEENDFDKNAFEKYSELDELGRCNVAFAKLGKETMPKEGEERQSISNVKPSGWQTKKYSKELVEGQYLYNRCHLIAYKLSAENDNEKNLITGTRYFNVNGMLPFETKVMEYLDKNKDKHVLYRVTPIYEGNNLVATGVQMEAKSVEDNGKSICFNVFVYNVQPGIEINYATGESWIAN